LKTKYFDVDLHWVAKHNNREMSVFYGADTDEEKWNMLKAAREGGNVTWNIEIF
jgi:hypothetical protein